MREMGSPGGAGRVGGHRRRESLLSSSFNRAEYGTFEMGLRDGSPRVVAYVKTSQGFDWNQGRRAPSRMNGTNSDSEDPLPWRVKVGEGDGGTMGWRLTWG